MKSKRNRNPRGSGEQLREDLIRVATELLEQPRLVDTPTLRQIAFATGIAPSAIYTRFNSHEELLQTAIDHQYKALREEVRSAISPAKTALMNLEAIALTYINWGIQHPGIYQLLFESADQLPEGLNATGPGFELLAQIAPLISEHTGCSTEASRRTTLRLWAALHGITSLRIHKNHAPWSSSIDVEASVTVRAFLGEPK